MDEKRMREVFSDEAFVTGLLALEEPGDVQAALKAKGITLSENEIVSLRDELAKLTEQLGEGDELSLDQLDEAAGGLLTATVVGIAALIAVTATGASVSVGLGAILGFAIGSRRW